jgi:hypothetical protein
VTCPECGGPVPQSGDCADRINELLEIESQLLDGSETLLRAHFFAIATYQLQHPSRMTAQAREGLREQHAQMVRAPRPIAELRIDVRRKARGVKVTKAQPSRSDVPDDWPVTWPMTAADVVARPVAEYVRAVHEWAAATQRTLGS